MRGGRVGLFDKLRLLRLVFCSASGEPAWKRTTRSANARSSFNPLRVTLALASRRGGQWRQMLFDCNTFSKSSRQVGLFLLGSSILAQAADARPHKHARKTHPPVSVHLTGLDPEDSASGSPKTRGKYAFADARLFYLSGEQLDADGKPFVPENALELFANSFAESDWDRDGCDDFGGEEAQPNCPQLQAELRAQLYAACVLEPQIAEFGDWTGRLPADQRRTVSKNLAAREAVRAELHSQFAAILPKIVYYYEQFLQRQQEDDLRRQAILVLQSLLKREPLARDAAKWQAQLFRTFDLLDRSAEGCALELRSHRDGTRPLTAVRLVATQECLRLYTADIGGRWRERERYLTLFGPGSAWLAAWRTDAAIVAEVAKITKKIPEDFVILTFQSARLFKILGNLHESQVQYLEAAKRCAELLQDPVNSSKSYDYLWWQGEALYFAATQCRARQDGSDGPIQTWPDAEVAAVKSDCEIKRRAQKVYVAVRDWTGPESDAHKPYSTNNREEGGLSAVFAMRDIVGARASLPATDPQRLEAAQWPGSRPTEAANERDRQACEKQKDCHLPTPNLDADVVTWLELVDTYILRFRKSRDWNDADQVPSLALQAAELLFKNRYFEPSQVDANHSARFWSARQRFWWIMREFPYSYQAKEAFKDLQASFRIEHNEDALARLQHFEPVRRISREVGKLRVNPIGDAADAAFAKGEVAERAAAARAGDLANSEDPNASARAYFMRAAELYYDLRQRVPIDDTGRQKAVRMRAALSYSHAGAWPEAVKMLDEAQNLVRTATALDAKDRALNVQRLGEILQTRAELHLKLFEIPEAIVDLRAVYANDPASAQAQAAMRRLVQIAAAFQNRSLLHELAALLKKRQDAFGRELSKVVKHDLRAVRTPNLANLKQKDNVLLLMVTPPAPMLRVEPSP